MKRSRNHEKVTHHSSSDASYDFLYNEKLIPYYNYHVQYAGCVVFAIYLLHFKENNWWCIIVQNLREIQAHTQWFVYRFVRNRTESFVKSKRLISLIVYSVWCLDCINTAPLTRFNQCDPCEQIHWWFML